LRWLGANLQPLKAPVDRAAGGAPGRCLEATPRLRDWIGIFARHRPVLMAIMDVRLSPAR
jgi:hypothetical protein